MKRSSLFIIALIAVLASGCGQSSFIPYGTGRTTAAPPTTEDGNPSSGAVDEPSNGAPADAPGEAPNDDDPAVDTPGETLGDPDSAETPDAVPDDDMDDPASPCQGFIEAVVSVSYGANSGFGQFYLPGIVMGPPRGAGPAGGGIDVISLGTGGEIVVDLGSCQAVDQAGIDFIVFENSFWIGGDPLNPFAEPAIVGVSLDGTTFVDFPCAPDAYPYTGCAGWTPANANPFNGIDPFDPEVAGGEAYDLQEIGVEAARYIRIVDVGNVGGGTCAGFDLDAIAVVNGMTAEVAP
jgi:hypothetical protein